MSPALRCERLEVALGGKTVLGPIDLELPLETVDARLFLELSRFGPYGPGNPEPTLALRSVAARGYPRIVGENHLKMVVARNGRTLDTIGFNLGICSAS